MLTYVCTDGSMDGWSCSLLNMDIIRIRRRCCQTSQVHVTTCGQVFDFKSMVDFVITNYGTRIDALGRVRIESHIHIEKPGKNGEAFEATDEKFYFRTRIGNAVPFRIHAKYILFRSSLCRRIWNFELYADFESEVRLSITHSAMNTQTHTHTNIELHMAFSEE